MFVFVNVCASLFVSDQPYSVCLCLFVRDRFYPFSCVRLCLHAHSYPLVCAFLSVRDNQYMPTISPLRQIISDRFLCSLLGTLVRPVREIHCFLLTFKGIVLLYLDVLWVSSSFLSMQKSSWSRFSGLCHFFVVCAVF